MLMSRQQIKHFSNHQWWRDNKGSIRPLWLFFDLWVFDAVT